MTFTITIPRVRPIVLALLAGALILGGLAWNAAVNAPPTLAFQKTWSSPSCKDVSSPNRGFWDDAPGAGSSNESLYVWVKPNESVDEYCSIYSNLNVSGYPRLSMRAAVNDGGRLDVYAYAGTGCSSTKLGQMSVYGSNANSGWKTPSDLLDGVAVRSICIRLGDYQDSHPYRVSALIDYIRLRNSGGDTGWEEHFTKSG